MILMNYEKLTEGFVDLQYIQIVFCCWTSAKTNEDLLKDEIAEIVSLLNAVC